MANTTLTQTGAQVQKDLNLTENLQDAFSTSATYKINDLVIYDGKVWKCHTAITSAGSWTGTTNWQQIKLADLPTPGFQQASIGTAIYLHTISLNSAFGSVSGLTQLEVYTTSSAPLAAGSYIYSWLAGAIKIIGNNGYYAATGAGSIIFAGTTYSSSVKTYKYIIYSGGTAGSVISYSENSKGPAVVADRVTTSGLYGISGDNNADFIRKVIFNGEMWYDQALSYQLGATQGDGTVYWSASLKAIPFFPFILGLPKAGRYKDSNNVYHDCYYDKIKFQIDGVDVYYDFNEAAIYEGNDTTGTKVLSLTGSGVAKSSEWLDIADSYYFEGTGACLTGDSLIKLGTGYEARLDEMSNDITITSYNLETGELIEDIAINVDNHNGHSGKFAAQLQQYTFSDGTVIKEVIRHRFLNLNKMEFINLCDWEIGDKIYKIDGTTPSLVKKEIIEGQVEHFTVTSQNHHNGFINGCLFGDRKTQKYKIIMQDGKPVYDKSEPHTKDYLYGEIK